MFFGRSLSGDQNCVATNSVDVLCARAIVRVVTNIRWDPELTSKIHMSPLKLRMKTMDRVEEETDPQAHPDPVAETREIQRRGRRLRVSDNDFRKYGFTDSCQRCEFLPQGKSMLAQGPA